MAPAAARKPARVPEVMDPLAIIEQYAQEDIVTRSEEFVQLVERVVATWGTEHERHITRIVTESTVITDAASYGRVGDALKEAAERHKLAESFFEPRKNLFYRVHQVVCRREGSMLKNVLAPWIERAKTSRFQFERAEAEARRAEEQRLAEEARIAEQDRLTKEAELYASRGEHDIAEQVLEQAVHTPAPSFAIASTLPRTQGVAPAKPNWKWRPIGGDTPQNRARSEKLVPREYLELSDRRLTAHAKSHGASARVPGIEFYDAGSVTVR